MITRCYCDRCNEPDPICEHGTNTAEKDCAGCAALINEKFNEEMPILRAELRAINNRRTVLRDRIEHLTGVRP